MYITIANWLYVSLLVTSYSYLYIAALKVMKNINVMENTDMKKCHILLHSWQVGRIKNCFYAQTF